ncbi:protein kinase [Herpetosiphon sp. NSE202]|uniref:protein kinase domain-containing protein n=1 Tax=Herpetosiphon sp. NSE202 TaxID=3351349 RepID=UPI00363B261C
MLPRTFGNYTIERELDRGGVAAVFLGQHRALPRQVAIKVLLNHTEELVERFQREAEITSKLRHPQIIEIYDHGMQGPFAYTVMAALMGGSLKRMLETAPQQHLTPELALSVFYQIGEALDFAHSQGIVHRDVSPGNILFDHDLQRVVLCDFGIARWEQAHSNTTNRVVMGTPGYFSPEHLRGAREVNAQSDIFGLGLILYAMLAGRLPWADPLDYADPQNVQPYPPISTLVGLSPDIDPIIAKLLAVDPAQRYQTVAEASAALRRIFSEHPALTTSEGSVSVQRHSIYLAPSFRAEGLEPNAVEEYLGPQLKSEPIKRAHRRAAILSQPEHLVNLLEAWSMGERFRRRNLGRLATFYRIQSQNIYYYKLDVLYEHRGEAFIKQEADRERQPMSGEMELGVWDVKLPEFSDFVASEGLVDRIKGSEQVSQCGRCSTKGNILCQKCKGNGRVTITKTVEKMVDVTDANGNKVQTPTQVVENEVQTCSDCKGKGYLVCPDCQGIGMIVKRKAFNWQRIPLNWSIHDDLPDVDEGLLQAEAVEVCNYMLTNIPKEWALIPKLDSLVEKAMAEVSKDKRIVLARLIVHMVPVTKLQFALGQQLDDGDVVKLYDTDNDADTPSVPVIVEEPGELPSDLFTLHLLGFKNTISEEESRVFRDWARIISWLGVAALAAALLITLIFVIFIY